MVTIEVVKSIINIQYAIAQPAAPKRKKRSDKGLARVRSLLIYIKLPNVWRNWSY